MSCKNYTFLKLQLKKPSLDQNVLAAVIPQQAMLIKAKILGNLIYVRSPVIGRIGYNVKFSTNQRLSFKVSSAGKWLPDKHSMDPDLVQFIKKGTLFIRRLDTLVNHFASFNCTEPSKAKMPKKQVFLKPYTVKYLCIVQSSVSNQYA